MFRLLTCLLGISIFLYGLFPPSTYTPSASTTEASSGTTRRPVFRRVVLMVVDALRYDFAFGEQSSMRFLGELVKEGAALPYIAAAKQPTVTLPRIKALTTGSDPSFLDMIFNFNAGSSSLKNSDTWLHRLKHEKNASINFYGDETWLKLFPDMFTRSEGTTSFFVADTTEVDQNVTRHLDSELASLDWDVLILHYLGLDHIGHLEGPGSSLMPKKQAEMDLILRRLYQLSLQDESLLVVLCGDHGMNEVGNHGGSSELETSAALAFINPRYKGTPSLLKRVNQIDFVSTISLLLGISIPASNSGRLIPDPLRIMEPDDLLASYHDISHQLSSRAGLCQDQSLCIPNLILNDTGSYLESIDYYNKILDKVSAILGDNAKESELSFMLVAVCLILFGLIEELRQVRDFVGGYELFIASLYVITLFSSSYVEEEHEFWYFASNVYLFMLFLGTIRYQAIGAMFVNRLMYGWNRTGNKYLGLQDDMRSLCSRRDIFVPVLNLSGIQIKWLFVSLCFSAFLIRALKTKSRISRGVLLTLASLVYLYKAATDLDLRFVFLNPTVLLYIARFFYLTHAVFITTCLWRLHVSRHLEHSAVMNDILDATSLLIALLSRTHNIPLLVLQAIQTRLLSIFNYHSPFMSLSAVHLIYFAFGNSNSLSTIDLSNAYVGVDGEALYTAGSLTFLSTYGPSIIGYLRVSAISEGCLQASERFFALWRVWSLLFLSISMIVFSNHLFIWSVFTPRYVYEIIWVLPFQLILNFATKLIHG